MSHFLIAAFFTLVLVGTSAMIRNTILAAD